MTPAPRSASKLLLWLLANGAFASCIYLGLWEGIDGAKNIALFLAWTTTACSLLLQMDSAIKYLVSRRVSCGAPQWASNLFDILVLGAFVWHGFWITAIGYFIQILCSNRIYDEVDQARRKEAKAAG